MKHCRVSAFVRVARVIAYAAVALGLGAGSLLAQGATGKVEGRVRDQAGAPIANAQVFVVGTAFNALTNPQGYYFINNIPASTVSLRANFIGYKSTQVEGVKVLAGQTITVDVQLEQTAVQLQEITVVQETQPLVPRDEVTTKQRVDGDFVDKLPVDRINQVLQLQPGVSADNAGRLSIRGGRNRESATYVDGVPVQAGYRGDRPFGAAATEISVSTNAVEEASVTTGSSSAEFGNAKSGIVAITTRTGGPQYRGSFGYESDEPFGVDHSVGLNRMQGAFSGPLAGRLTFAVSGTLEGRRAIEDGFNSQDTPIFLQAGLDTVVHQATTLDDPATEDVVEGVNSDTTLVPVYNYAISRGKCDAFANSGEAGLAGGDSSYINKIRNNFGLDCNGVRLPATARTLYQASGKLNYTYGTGSRVALSLSSSRNAGHAYPAGSPIRYYNLLSLNNNLLGFNQRNQIATFNWTQNLAKSAERALALDVALSYQQDRSIQSPLTTESDLGTRDPFGGFILKPMHFLFDFDNFPITDELVTNFRRNQGRFVPFDASNAAQYAVTDQTRNNAYALYGKYGGFFNTLQGENWQFGESGGPATPLRLDLYKEQRYIGKANLDWQVDRYNRVKLGGEFTRYSIDNYSGRLTSKNFDDIYKEKPIRWNTFVEDRLDLGDVVVVGGLRYDYFDSRASRPFVSDTNGNRYAFPRISSYKDVTNNGNLVDTGFDPSNPTGKYVRDKSHNYLSPHVQVSFPVTDRTNFRLSYSHQVQAPDFALLFAGINEDIDLTNTNQVYGTDLDFGKTITFEFGIRHAFSDDMVLDLAAYNKDIISDPAARLVRLYDPVQKADNDFRMLTNLDFGNVRGLDVRLDRRFGNYFNGTVSYSYQQAKNTGSDPFTYIFYNSRIVNQVGGINGAQPPPQGILPTDNSRPHTLAGALSLTFPHDFRTGTALGSVLKDFSVFATFRYASGTAYSKCGETSDAEQSVLSIENCQNLFPEGINTQRLPSYKQFDARFTKGFSLGKLDLTGYLDVRNLLNFKNIIEVFAVTGVPSNASERDANLQTDLSDIASEGGQNGAITGDGSLDLSFAGAADPRASCGTWVSSQQKPAASNCVYLIRAEERYGDGDHIFTVDEQTRAINALYDAGRGEQVHTEPGRRARLGFEINF